MMGSTLTCHSIRRSWWRDIWKQLDRWRLTVKGQLFDTHTHTHSARTVSVRVLQLINKDNTRNGKRKLNDVRESNECNEWVRSCVKKIYRGARTTPPPSALFYFFFLLLRHRVVFAVVKCLATGSGSLSVLNGRSFHCWVVFVIFSLTLTICLAVFLPSRAELVAGFYLDWNRRLC